MFLPILLLIQCFALGQAKNQSGHFDQDEDLGGFEALQNLLDVLENCWPHRAMVVAFPHPLTDSFLNDLVYHGKNRALFLDISAVDDDFAYVGNMAKEKMRTYVLLGDLNELTSVIKDNYQTLVATSNKVTWVLPEDMKEELNLENTRLDSLQLFFSFKNQSSVTVHEVFGYKGEEISENIIGSNYKNSGDMCNRIGGKSQRRQKILHGKALHFVSVTPYLRTEQDVLKMADDVAFYSASVIIRYHLLELAKQTQLTLRETNIYALQPLLTKNRVWLNALQLLAQNNSFDVIGDSYGYTFERMKIVDFTKSAYVDRIFFVSRVQHSGKLHLTNFLSLFSPLLWFAICIIIILLGICFAIFDFTLQNNTSSSQITSTSFVSSLLYWWCSLTLMLLQRGSFTFSPNIGMEFKSSKAIFMRQLLLIVASMLFFIIFSLFASNLTSILITAPDHEPLFSELTDLLAPGINIGVLYNVGLSYFKDAKKGSPWHDIYHEKLEPQKNNGLLDSAIAAKEFLSSHEQSVIFDNVHIELLTALKNLEIEKHAKHSRIFGMALPLRKNSDLAEMLNYFIMKLAEAGVVQKFEKMWLPSKRFTRNTAKNRESVGTSNVNFQSVTFLFMILATGSLLALILLIVEVLYHWFCKRKLDVANNRIQSLEGGLNP